MTGFGAGVFETADAGATARVEIRAVNNRGAKISIRSRPALNEYEKKLRDLIAEHLQRGSIDVYVSVTRQIDAGAGAALAANARALITAIRAAADELNLAGSLTVSDLLHLPGLFGESFNAPLSEAEWEAIAAATALALEQHCAMRETEGAATAARLLEIVQQLDDFRALAREHAPQVVARQREKLQNYLAEIGAARDVDKQSVEREIVFFADRADINEELDRLASHCQQFRDTLAKGGEVGKRLEFLAQEFLREVNTTASKANDLTITAAAVEAKTAVEKLKEQTANLE
jgi:uncharacterized protein (TIGR00255 family)